MSEFDRSKYLEDCFLSERVSGKDLAMCGIVLVLVLAGVDLVLTLAKIWQGSFVDDNPIAQVLIANGMHGMLVVFKLTAAALFALVCIKHRHRLSAQIGVGIAALVHLVVFFHWMLVF